MSELKNYMLGDYRSILKYSEQINRYGLSKLPPLIISCAITGAQHGAEANMNLPETAEAQAQSTYDAYNAGASLVHVHARNPQNLAVDTSNSEDYKRVNHLIREKCPEIIINNTCIGGRLLDVDQGTISDKLHVSLPACPEVASIDIATTTNRIKMKGRKPPLTGGHSEDWVKHFDYVMTDDNAVEILNEIKQYGIKPEWEMYNITDIKQLNRLMATGIVEEPYWIQMLFGGNGVQPSAQSLMLAADLLPEKSLFSVIAIGGTAPSISALAIILGHHVRVGLEDAVYYAPHQKAESNAQLVERVVKLARLLGREVATPAQAREMLGLGAPRAYD